MQDPGKENKMLINSLVGTRIKFDLINAKYRPVGRKNKDINNTNAWTCTKTHCKII